MGVATFEVPFLSGVVFAESPAEFNRLQTMVWRGANNTGNLCGGSLHGSGDSSDRLRASAGLVSLNEVSRAIGRSDSQLQFSQRHPGTVTRVKATV